MLDGMFDWFDPSGFDLSGLDLGSLDFEMPGLLDGLEMPEFAEFGSNPFEGLFLDPNLLGQISKIALPGGPGAGSPGSGMASNPFDTGMLGQIAKLFGGTGGVLGALGTIGGGINAGNATKEAQERMERAVGEANDTVRGILGGAGDAFKPYTQAGADALARLSAQPPSNLAANYGPIGAASNLAATRRPVGTLSSLAANYRPLGSGRGLRG